MDPELFDQRCRDSIREEIWLAVGTIVHLRRLSAKIVFFDLRLSPNATNIAIAGAKDNLELSVSTLTDLLTSPSISPNISQTTRLNSTISDLAPDQPSSACTLQITEQANGRTDPLTTQKIEVVLKASECPDIKSMLRTLRIGTSVKVSGRRVENLEEASRRHLLYHASDVMVLRTAAEILADMGLGAVLERPLKIENGWAYVTPDLGDRGLPVQPVITGNSLYEHKGWPAKRYGTTLTSADVAEGSGRCTDRLSDRVTNEGHCDVDTGIAESPDLQSSRNATSDSRLDADSGAGILPSSSAESLRGVCKYWINSRHCINRELCPFSHPMLSEDFKVAKVEWISGRVERRRVQLALADDPLDPHLKRKKGVRAACFADWLVNTFGAERLCEGRGVLDVAGGKGSLAFAMHSVRGISTTLIDPRPRKLTKAEHKHLQKNPSSSLCHTIQREFEAGESMWSPIIGSCSCLVGLHPDEATESIVVAAVKFRKPFAVIPCCVFPNLFPHRVIIENGVEQQVRVYEQFIKYLAKLGSDGGGNVETGWLNIEGRNQVLFCKSCDG